MGALHEGHLELIKVARNIASPNGCVAVSIFVNPIQFDNAGDLANYPNTLKADLKHCEELGVDIVFTPTPEVLYSENRSITVTEDSLSNKLCGANRPGHFDGVCTVVTKLFNLFTPLDAVFGKKDFQQLAIINRLVRDLNIQTIIHGVDTVRELDGLALSSRNVRLSSEARAQAPAIRKALLSAEITLQNGEQSSDALLNMVKVTLNKEAPSARIDYIECIDAVTLQNVNKVQSRSVIALAAFFDDVRLIDNIELNPTSTA